MLAPGLATAAIVAALVATSPAASAATRDPLVQPFAATSPWNTPLGNRAQYTAAGLGDGPVGIEAVVVVPAPAEAAAARLARTTCAVPGTGWLVLLDASALAATSYRCAGGTAGAGAKVDLTGQGMPGHRFSALLAPGGAVTAGELAGERPLRHALALSVPGTRLPAGTLLALPPRVAAGLRPRTAISRRLLAALRDYGGYVSATRTSAVRIRLRMDAGSTGSAGVAAGPDLDPVSRRDLATMVGELAVVTRPAPPSPSPGPPAPTPARPTPASAAAPAPAPVAVAARPVAETTPRGAPTPVLWSLAGLAATFLAIGLRGGRRLARGR